MRAMAEWLSERGHEPIIIDNNSCYPPLLEYYERTPYQVHRLNFNGGHRVIWHNNILIDVGITGEYIATDSDLILDGIPDDFVQQLQKGLDRYPEFEKAGFSLDLDRLPDTEAARTVYGHEIQYWNKPLDDKFFEASVDTTFALYRTNKFTYKSLRTNKPYCARHVTWEYDRFEDLSDEEKYYYNTANKSYSGKGRIRI